jgi:YXWGXW repeat-containing protein
MKLVIRGIAAALVAFAVSADFAGSAQAEVAIVVGERGMPAPIVEVVPAARPGYTWVPGHYVWRGRAWFWVKGHHERGVIVAMPEPVVEVVPARPSAGHVWIKGHHAFERGRWVWHPGVWVRI